MLNNLVERGQVKCHQYWPDGEANGDENELIFEDVNIKVELSSTHKFDYYMLRKFKLTDLLVRFLWQFFCTATYFCFSVWNIKRSAALSLYSLAWLWPTKEFWLFSWVSLRRPRFGLPQQQRVRSHCHSLQCRHWPFGNICSRRLVSRYGNLCGQLWRQLKTNLEYFLT